MGTIYFVLGGARSGKSTFANELATKLNKSIAFIATSPYFDDNMKERIERHKKERPQHWHTFENIDDLPALLESIDTKFDTVLIDCLTLYISMFLLDNKNEEYIKKQVDLLLNVLKKTSYSTIIVSNEVGMGIHPESSMGRDFRDITGRANQMVAAQADEVFFIIAGIPLKIKGENTCITSNLITNK